MFIETLILILTFMEPCIVVWLVAITNEMQLSKGIYYVLMYGGIINSLTKFISLVIATSLILIFSI